MSLKVRLLAGIGAASLLAGCGGSAGAAAGPSAAKTKFVAAVTQLFDSSALTVTVRPQISQTALAKLLPASRLARAQRFVNSSLTVAERAPSGTLAQLAKAGGYPELSMTLQLGGINAVDVVGTASDLYLRINFPQLHTSAPPRGLSLPPQLATQGFVQKALAGDWLAIPMAQLRALAGSTPVAAEQALLTTLEKDVTVTGSNGTYTLTANARTLGQDLFRSLGAAGSVFSSRLPSPTKLPSQNVRVQASTQGGVLSQLSVNLAQFASPAERTKLGASQALLLIDFTQSATASSFTPPASATPLNLSQLAPLFLGASGARSASGSAAA